MDEGEKRDGDLWGKKRGIIIIIIIMIIKKKAGVFATRHIMQGSILCAFFLTSPSFLSLRSPTADVVS